MQGKGYRVLVAEDNVALAAVVRYNLEQAKYTVVVVSNGREAWEQLQAGEFDLVVTDQQMPHMSGSELCRHMRQQARLRDLPVVMLTAKGLELESGKLRDELGVQRLVHKPFSPRDLVTTVHNCLLEAAAASVPTAI